MFDEDRANPLFKEFQLSRVRCFDRFGLSFVHCSRGMSDNASRKQRQESINHFVTRTRFHADYFPVRVAAGPCRAVRNVEFQALQRGSVAPNVIQESFC